MVQLLILLVIIVLLFGTKKLRNLGGDLGSAIKGFKKGLADDDPDSPKLEADPEPEASTTAESVKTESGKE